MLGFLVKLHSRSPVTEVVRTKISSCWECCLSAGCQHNLFKKRRCSEIQADLWVELLPFAVALSGLCLFHHVGVGSWGSAFGQVDGHIGSWSFGLFPALISLRGKEQIHTRIDGQVLTYLPRTLSNCICIVITLLCSPRCRLLSLLRCTSAQNVTIVLVLLTHLLKIM